MQIQSGPWGQNMLIIHQLKDKQERKYSLKSHTSNSSTFIGNLVKMSNFAQPPEL